MTAPLRIDEGIWSIDVALDDYAVRGALLLGNTHAVVWDTLSHPRDMDAVAPLIGSRPLVIVYSHADWDHVWGTGGLPSARALIVGHETCRQRFDADVPLTLAQRRAEQPGRWDAVRLVPPNRSFTDELVLDLGGLTLSLRHLPGHTRDCIVGFVPERGVLLAGDTVETPCPVIPPDSPLRDWIGELERWAGDERVKTVVPAHGPIGGPELLLRNIVYLRGILDGAPIAPGGALTPFYAETHQHNMSWRG